MAGPRRQPDLLEQRRGQLPRVDPRRPPQRVIQRHQDIVQGGSPRQEVEALKDEAQLRCPHQGPLVGRKAAHLLAVEPELAGTRPVETAQNVHERGLARPGRPHQSYHLALGNGKGYTLQYGYVHFTKVVGFGDVLQADQLVGDGRAILLHFGITLIVAHRGINRQAHNGRRGEGGGEFHLARLPMIAETRIYCKLVAPKVDKRKSFSVHVSRERKSWAEPRIAT